MKLSGLTFSVTLALLAAVPFAVASPLSESQKYDSLYPRYAEFCGATQIKKKRGFGAIVEGGIGGHGFLYLQGACRDMDSRYPRIQPCQGGVGVSVNSDFMNVNWIAVQSKSFLLYGDVEPGTRITPELYEATRAKAQQMELLRGVEFHPKLFAETNVNKPRSMPNTEYMWEDTFGTDYAIAFGRSIYCTRMPVTEAMMDTIVKTLNQANEQYFLTGVPYQWSGVMDNCTHATHNGLASALIWEPLATHKQLLFQIFNLAVPGDDFIDLLRRGNKMDLTSPLSIYNDEVARASLMTYGWLPTQHGVMPEIIPIHEPTDLYLTKIGMLFLELPFFRQDHRAVKKATSDPRLNRLGENIQWYIARYKYALETMPSLKDYLGLFNNPDANMTVDSEEFKAFYERYVSWLKNQLEDARKKSPLIEMAD